VAGGSGIIGRAICQSFGQHGWHIGIHYHHNHDDAKRTAHIIQENGGTATLLQTDCRDCTQVERMVQTFVAETGRLDALVYSVGLGANSLLVRTTSESWTDLLLVNLTGCFVMLKTIGPILQKQQEGTVIIVGSLSSLLGSSGQTAYAASKAGLMGLMKTAAREWGPDNIRVNAILPGWQASPLSGMAFPDPSQLQDHVLGRTSSADEVAKAVYQLTHLKEVSGQIWNLDSRIW
jgi:3-oxoacyl-[acyl-carrier protein] reductase